MKPRIMNISIRQTRDENRYTITRPDGYGSTRRVTYYGVPLVQRLINEWTGIVKIRIAK